MSNLAMPRLSDSMEEGTILKWLKQDGDEVRRGEELVEIETDKANMTYESDADGKLEIVAKEGDTLPIGETIARIGDGSPDHESSAAVKESEEPIKEEPKKVKDEKSAPPPQKEEREVPKEGDRIKASPVARRIARERGISLEEIQGSGPGGRIIKSDIESARPVQAEVEPKVQDDSPATTAPVKMSQSIKGDVTIVEPSRLQQTVARRMAESKATAPEFILNIEVDMERAVGLRSELKSASEERPPSFNDFVVKATALALREHPRANASYRDGRFELYSRINIGIAVAGQDALIVPTIFDTDRKSLGEIARDSRNLAQRVRSGEITPPELSGGTFTISNLGMFGIKSFVAIINPPQSAILSVGSLAQRAVVRDGQLVARHTMSLSLACDHRILYGADAAAFLSRVGELLENPVLLAL